VDGPRAGPPGAGQPRHGPVRPRGGAVRAGHRHPAFDPADDGPPERRWPQLAGPPPPASSRNPEVPAAVDRAVAALLAPDPADRPASAAQVLALLAGALPADAAEEDRLWPTWATGRLAGWQAPPWRVPRWLHDLRRHCRWHIDAPCQNGCHREDCGSPRAPVPEQPSWGPGGPRAGVHAHPVPGSHGGAEPLRRPAGG
jgi:hypothetical protein